MGRLPKLDHVKYVKSRGKVYAYFNTGRKKANGATVYKPLPHPSEPGFYDSYAACKGHRTKREATEYTIAAMVKEYRASQAFTDRKAGTRMIYGYALDKIEDTLGEVPVNDLQDSDIRDVLEGEDWGASTRNMFVAVIRVAYKWAREKGKTTLHPFRDYNKAKTGEHQPWPETILGAGLSADNARVRLAVHLLYYTGQRIGDVCKMRWSDIRNGKVYVRQQKTGKERDIHLHSALASELAKVTKRGITILTTEAGKQIDTDTLRREIIAFTETAGFRCVPHGLRKNAVNALLEAGCTVAEVASITGQTFQVVEHYAAKVNTRKLGEAAILKWDVQRAERKA